MRRTAIAALALALASVLAAHGAAAGQKARTVLGSCTFPATCQDYDASKDDAKRRCEAFGARWRDQACPEAGLVATCVNAWDEGEASTHFYRPTTRAEAARVCSEGRGTLR